jgi:hypothetical protein
MSAAECTPEASRTSAGGKAPMPEAYGVFTGSGEPRKRASRKGRRRIMAVHGRRRLHLAPKGLNGGWPISVDEKSLELHEHADLLSAVHLIRTDQIGGHAEARDGLPEVFRVGAGQILP